MRCSWELKKNYFIKFLSPLSFKKKNIYIYIYFLFLSSASLLSSFFVLIFFSLPHLLFASPICSSFIFIAVPRRRPISPSLPSHRRPTRLASPVSIVLGFSGIPVHADPLANVALDGPRYFTIPILLGLFTEWTRWPTRNFGFDSAKSSCIFFFFFLLRWKLLTKHLFHIRFIYFFFLVVDWWLWWWWWVWLWLWLMVEVVVVGAVDVFWVVGYIILL